MRHGLIAIGTTCLAVLTAAGCGGGSGGAAPTGGAQSSAAPQFAELPTRRCHTEVGFEGSTPVPLDATSPTGLPASTPHDDLAAYRNRFGTTLIGPRGWHCRSVAGVDGNEYIVISPKALESLEPKELGDEAVTLQRIPSCVGCQAEALCTLYPDAPPVKGYSPRLPCDEKALRERTESIGPYSSTFEDPPGTKGLGVPSGGDNAAIGVLAYAKYHGVGKITCALSAPRAAACPAIAMAAITPLMAG